MSEEMKNEQPEEKEKKPFLQKLFSKKKKKKKRRLDTDPIHLACLGAAILLIFGVVIVTLISSEDKIETQVNEVDAVLIEETGKGLNDVWEMIENEEFDTLNDIFFEEE